MNSTSAASRRCLAGTIGALVVLLCAVAPADVRLPAVIGDNMVLQAGSRVSLWGWADPNEEINVAVSWRKVDWTIQADNAGKWSFQMTAPDVSVLGKNGMKS